jgi:glycosyltransferase involved in cell wall biosynthesis
VRILLVNDYGVPFGGAELQMLALREGLRTRGHDVRLLASSAGLESQDAGPDYRCLGTTSPFRTLLQTANPAAHRLLRRVLRDFRPDVVHVRLFLTQLSPLILPLVRRVPSLYHVVWYRAVCPTGTKLLPNGDICRVRAGTPCYVNGCVPLRDWPLHMLQRRLVDRWIGAFDRIVGLSETVAAELEAAGIGPVEVMGNAVPVRPRRPPLEGPPTLAFAGRLVREKGADVLVNAFAAVAAEIPDAQLLVAGDGPERARLEAGADALELASRIMFLGHVPAPELERVLAKAWVQVVPSRWREPFGNAGAEALMRGTAVVASDTAGLATVVEPGRTGELVPAGDPASLAMPLVRLLRDRDLAETMGRRARAFALRRLTLDAYLDRLVALYESLTTRSATQRATDRAHA